MLGSVSVLTGFFRHAGPISREIVESWFNLHLRRSLDVGDQGFNWVAGVRPKCQRRADPVTSRLAGRC
ncbi:hypothetical protein I7I48_00085 [Histoplasma ohiense]|nr:hypothetical protein I7I48_00085 [Histoplasma ohiense (nom. inval.)]